MLWMTSSSRLREIALDAFSSIFSHKDSLKKPKTQNPNPGFYLSQKEQDKKPLLLYMWLVKNSLSHLRPKWLSHTQIRVLPSVEFLVLGVTKLVIVAIQATQQKKEHNYSKNPTI